MWGSILSFFSLFYLFSCHGHPKIITPKFNNEFQHQLSNFTFLVKEAHLTFCDEVDKKMGTCDEVVFPEASASGVVISQSKSHVFILTANHFCIDTSPEEDMSLEGDRVIKAFIGDTEREAQILYEDDVNDLCLLGAIKLEREAFKPGKICKQHAQDRR